MDICLLRVRLDEMNTEGIERIQCIFFSPTGTTHKTVQAIAKGTGLRIEEPIDLTLPGPREAWNGSTEGDILVVGVPVYSGTIPSMTLDPLHRLDGEGQWAVPVAVYGVRSPEDTVAELSGLLRARGFKILAAANFVAEHSFSHDKLPLALGRPNKEDLKIANQFGKKIMDKLGSEPNELSLESKPLKNGENYKRKREDWPENRMKGSQTRVSDFNGENCSQCNACIEVCPMRAIDPQTYTICDADCIRCFACTRACPTDVRKIQLSPRAMEVFTALLDTRKKPEILI